MDSTLDDETKTPIPEPRIRFLPDEEAAEGSRYQRPPPAADSDNLSIRSWRSRTRRGSVDPAITLPIQYRTVSFDISESKARHVEEVKKAKESTADELSKLDWHILPVEDVTQRLSTSPSLGLSIEQVQRKIQEYGKNAPSPPPTHYTKQIFGYFFKGFGSILLVGSILVFIAWKPLGQPPAIANLALAIVLLAVFFIQAGFNAYQDWSTSRVMSSITSMLPDQTTVIRDGKTDSIDASELVPGDVVTIRAGTKLPADVRLIDVDDVRFDRSILTGESLPIGGSVDSTDTNYLETQCIGLQGTHCISGSAVGVVVATGDKTVFGRIAKLTHEPKSGMTTLEREILRFVTIIVSIMVTMIIVVVIIWSAWLRKDHPGYISVPTLIVSCVSVAIAFIPEGLPIALTASLTIMANLMKKNQILCKSLKTVETLGAVSVICSDKTGTLTKNIMTVTACWIGTRLMTPEATQAFMGQRHRSLSGGFSSPVNQLRTIASLCNAAEFDPTEDGVPLKDRKITGDATDQSIMRFSEGLGPRADLLRLWKKYYEVGFNSKNKYMLRLFDLVEHRGLASSLSAQENVDWTDGDLLLTVKGAPDILIKYCTHYTGEDGERHEMDAAAQSRIEGIKNEWSSQGKRVILLARRTIRKDILQSTPSSNNFEGEISRLAKQDLTLVGLLGIVDPPRDEILGVVSTLRRAGIKIFMVTGDYALTAQAIAAQCGIITNSPHLVRTISDLQAKEKGNSPALSPSTSNTSTTSLVLSGPDLTHLTDEQWTTALSHDELVFARTTPQQKLQIVRRLQAAQQIVSMTGDGVNDAPSLSAADIGIAIGGGSPIAIEAADMVLLSSSLAGMVEAVRYGRVVFDNLKKTIAYLLPAGSFAEFWPVMTNVAFGLPQILSSFLMIIICCFTDCVAGTVLCLEQAEADVMLRPPRNTRKDRLVDWKLILQSYGFIGIVECTSSFAMGYWYLARHQVPFSTLWFGFNSLPANLTQEEFTARLNTASSIYFVTLVVMQWFALLALRTRHLSIFQHPPLGNKDTNNWALWPAMGFAFLMAIFWLYVPTFHGVLGTAQVPVEHWFLPLAFGVGLLGLEEGRKAWVRRWPRGLVGRCAW